MNKLLKLPEWWKSDKTYIVTDAMSGFKSLPDEVLDCIVTSPPYFGLRDYEIPPMIFGGNNECEHNWENNFCISCNAWKGQLGLEPTIDLYISNLCDIFEEAMRCL